MSVPFRNDSDRAIVVALLAEPMTSTQLARAAGWTSTRTNSAIDVASRYDLLRRVGKALEHGRMVNVYQTRTPEPVAPVIPALVECWPGAYRLVPVEGRV